MAFTLHSGREKATNKSACDLVALVEIKVLGVELPEIETGSCAEVDTIDWTEKQDKGKPTIWRTTDENEDVTAVFEEQPDKTFFGFGEANYSKFKKFIDTLYFKNKEINRMVSLGFVADLTFEWVLTAHKTSRITCDYLSYLKDQINPKLGNYKFYYVVPLLHIEQHFTVGNVSFEYFKEDFFSNKLGEKPDKKERAEQLREMFRGKVFACYTIKGVENKRGEQLAYEQCCKAVDVLKLYSPTAYYPKKKSPFDIDRRVKVIEQHDYLSENLDEISSIHLNMSAGAVPHTITNGQVELITLASKHFSDLISKTSPNELQSLVINALGRFSATLSQSDFNQRVADIFSVWESLLLKDKSAVIGDSLRDYGAYLLRIPIKEKEAFCSFIDHMYDVRCDLVHHAIKKPVSTEKMTQLQHQTIQLMEDIIILSQQYQTKKDMIEGIDLMIAQAALFGHAK